MNVTKERILLVENDPELSDLISRQTLRPLGYQVEIVGAAAQAIDKATRFLPDVILADLNLPGLSGKDLLVALNSQGLEIPIIVISPKGMEGDVIQAFRLGAADLIYWPIREAEIVAAVERVLGQVRSRREREALALELKQANQEMSRRVRELTTIFAIGKAVITTTDQQDLFHKIVEGAVFVSEADSGWLLVREESSRSFYLKACRNLPKEIASRTNQPWDDGISSLVALSGEPLTIHGEPLKRFKISQLGQSAIVVPVKVKKEVVGLLVGLRKSDTPFSSGQQALLEALADYASISLVNTHLFKALEERVTMLQMVANSALIDKHIEEELLTKTTHELQNAIHKITTNLSLLPGKDTGKMNKEQNSAMGIILENLSSAQEIVERVQSMSGSRGTQKSGRANLHVMIKQVIQRLQPLAQRSGVKLTAELPDKPLLARADPFHIDKVLEGLLTNAIHFSRQGSLVKIRVETPNENTVMVEVLDYGAGIDPKQISLIFQPTARDQMGYSAGAGGIGISLPLMHEIISHYGGRLWADSQPGQGSAFYFSLQTIPK
jgi:signal transduction histidine kinase